jgi:hypothetical protein
VSQHYHTDGEAEYWREDSETEQLNGCHCRLVASWDSYTLFSATENLKEEQSISNIIPLLVCGNAVIV